jgi:hypothetical protein
MVYISITGLRVKGPLQELAFWWHAIPSMRQAKTAAGNISAEARTINGVRHTLSVWIDKRAMRAYLTSGAHKSAMAGFSAIATGHAFGYEAENPPGWDEVHGLWLEADPARRVAKAAQT